MVIKYLFRLWHPLTTEIRSLLKKPAFIEKLNLKEFYDRYWLFSFFKNIYFSFVSTFEHRINCLHLVEIILPVAKFVFDKSNIL